MDGVDGRMSLDLESTDAGGSPALDADIRFAGTDEEFEDLRALAAAAGLVAAMTQRLEPGEAPRLALVGDRVEDSLRLVAVLGIPHGAAIVIHGGGDRWPSEPFGVVPAESPLAALRAMEGVLLDMEARRTRGREYVLRPLDNDRAALRTLARKTMSAALPEGGRGFDHRAANAAPRSQRRGRR